MRFLLILLLISPGLLRAQTLNIQSQLDKAGCSGIVLIMNSQSGDYFTNDQSETELKKRLYASTKSIVTLVALEEGLISEKTDRLQDAFENSDLEYFKELDGKLKAKRVSQLIEQSGYASGNYKKIEFELRDDKGTLESSVLEQVQFINSIIRDKAPFSEDTRMTFKSLFSEETGKGYKLYYNSAGNKGQTLWLNGWLEQGSNNYPFCARFIKESTDTKDWVLDSHLDILKTGFRQLNLYDQPERQRIADSIAAVKADTNYTLKTFYSDNPNLKARVEQIVSKMSNAQLAGQMIIPAAGRWGNSSSDIEKAIKEGKIGGLLMLKGEKTEFTNLIKKYNKLAEESGTIPLMYSADAEPSLINYKIKNIPTIPKTNTLKTIESSREAAREIIKLLKEIGIQYNYAPDCDLGVNKAIIGNRSYGNDTKTVAKLAGAFIEESTESQIVTTAKHFPGHGLVKGDSHLNLVVIDGEMKELDTYKRLIADSLLSIMIGHIAVKNNEKYSTAGIPASCSAKIVTDLLRKEMGFNGLIITDGMGMGALKQLGNADLLAAKAGCDLLLMSTNPLKVHNDLVIELNKDELFKKQVYESVKRIIRLKLCLGIMK